MGPEHETHTSSPSAVAPDAAAGPIDDADGGASLQFGNPSRYRIIAEHGHGGLGRVWRAHDRGLGRDVAIKELLSRGVISEIRFVREALITARLEHPGIVPIHEAGRRDDGTPYYAMKLVSGRPLRDLIEERKTVAERITLLHHVIAVADAIAYAHGRRIIHRDLKPANIIVGDFGETVVIDWGLAKELSDPDDATQSHGGPLGTPDEDVTSAGSVLGTPIYMAPEQERGEPVDQRADVFAIGAMLWELCALPRVPPYDLRHRHRLLQRAGIDWDLMAIIDKAIEPDPARRYPDAGALAADLKAFKAGARIAARSYSLPAMIAHWTRRHRAIALAAMAFLILLVGSVVALAVLYDSSRKNAAVAQDRLVQSHEEQGRRLLLEGEYLRALPYLSEAYTEGDRSISLRFLLARAERLAGQHQATHTHSGFARAAAFRPDGRHVISAAENGEAAVWDAASGDVIARLPAMPEQGPRVRRYPKVSPDGRFAALPRSDGVALWDGTSTHIVGPPSPERIALSSDGRWLAVTAGGELSVWNVASGVRAWTLPSTPKAIQLGWCGDAVLLLGMDQQLRILEPVGARSLPIDGVVGTFAVGPSGQIAVTVDEAVELWHVAGQRRARFPGHGDVTTIALSPDATHLAIGRSTGMIQLYDTTTMAKIEELMGHHGRVSGLAFSEDGSQLASDGSDLTVRTWRVSDGHGVAVLRILRDMPVPGSLRFDAAGQRLVEAASASVRVLAAGDSDAALTIDAREALRAGQFLDEGRSFGASSKGVFQIWSVDSGARRARLEGLPGSMVRVSPDGAKLVAFDENRALTIEIRDVSSDGVIGRLHGHGRLTRAAFDRTGTRIVTGSDQGLVELWDLSGNRLTALPGATSNVATIAFSPDGRQVASGEFAGIVRLWDIASGRAMQVHEIKAIVHAVAFDPAGNRVLAGSADGMLRIWNTSTGELLRSFEHPGEIQAVAIDASGAFAASAARDGTVSVWDAATAALLTEFHHAAWATDVTFSPAGDRLLSTSDDHHAVIWHLDAESRAPEVVAAFVRCHAPYRLVDGRLDVATLSCDRK
jgi:eukaryotic-like serine/threonine-protein kinase